jgi:hypothetical protein
MLGGNQQVLQRATEADVQFTLVGVGDLEPASPIRMEVKLVLVDCKLPGLGIVA